MNKFALGAALAALSLAVPGSAIAQRTPAASIVIVDTARIYRECTACRAAQTQLQTMGTALQTRQQQLGQPLQTEATSIEQAATAARNLTGAARTRAAQNQGRFRRQIWAGVIGPPPSAERVHPGRGLARMVACCTASHPLRKHIGRA